MKIVQLAGGNADSEKLYTGPERELRVDLSNDDLLLHDSTTPGGRRIQNQNNADQRYHPKSDELAGIGPYLPEQRGFLVRRAPGEYRIRKITVDTDSLIITNGDGYAGDTLIELNPVINIEVEFTQSVIIDGVLQVNGGINADISGDTIGTHTGPVIGNVTGNVVGNVTGNTTGIHTGDVNVQGANLLLDDNQIDTAKINGLLAFVQANGVPLGCILQWSGAVINIPAGWALCDGVNGPDLRDKFVMAQGPTYPVGATGGAASHGHVVTLTGAGLHDHGISVGAHALTLAELPPHTHTVQMGGGDHGTAVVADGSGLSAIVNTGSAGSGAAHTHSMAYSGDGSHTHAASSDSVSNLPPFYALAYIIKIS